MDNLILSTDSYKSCHYLCYPPNMDGMFSYIESRGGKYENVLWFGLQAILKRYFTEPITLANIAEADDFFKAHGEPFPLEGWMSVLLDHGGKIPLRIKSVPEGTVVPTHNVLMTVESTDPKLFWLVSWFETLLMRTWYPTTVATISMYCKKYILEALKRTGDPKLVDFKLHDFGARGVSSGESAAIGGAAHLVNFMGSDTVEGVCLANKVYDIPMAGFSIPAAEHSTITAWGKESEVDAFENMLNKFAKPQKLVAVVSDSYDLWNAIDHLWGEKLRQKIIDSGATVILRPDSGSPIEVVVKALKMLDEKFGSVSNNKGFKVLNNVRVIQGDGINPDSIQDILAAAARAGYSADNVSFGMGGGLLQHCNRDTQRFAYKCSAAHFPVLGWVDVRKDPITDPEKASKGGRLTLYSKDGVYRTGIQNESWEDKKVDMLQEVLYNGITINKCTFQQVRERARMGLERLISPY